MLESKRLTISKPKLSFAEELYRIHSNKLATLYTPKRRHKSIDDTKKMLKEWEQYWNSNSYGYFIFIEKESTNVIGSGGAKKMEFANKEYFNLYYRLDPKATGNGYAIEAMVKILNWLHYEIDNTLPFVIRTDKSNLASINLAHKLGFQKDVNFDNFTDEGDVFFFKNLS
ncbi:MULTISPECIES: GNAT family N-acetyltransferase [Staphylococcus]|uniref:GNAT family N-acetyltransferase n=1 Tax=Staphylococcus TaxID=1279 RepID=UPI0015F9E4CF|nr:MULTISPECIES: GNAT family N-acetyltransferase [Staphylococcus]MCD8822438.1 GNAT family N-acetyltransferase [Staphylococcus gallinarum]